MDNIELKTEQIILEAAEAEFLEKGYASAKTVSIAQRAGVSHSMLHYYFRTKELLFQRIFKAKVQTLAQMFGGIFEHDRPFPEMVRLIVETQFNFAAQNPQLPRFIFNEILSNSKNREWALSSLAPVILPFLRKIETMLNNEIAKGTAKPIAFGDFMLNALALNISTFIAMPILSEVLEINSSEQLKEQLDKRRESNVQFILNALRP
jgi:AcrR family transcriptional regulator